MKHNNFVTTKENKELHGMGTKIIKSIADTYHGTADFIVSDTFQVVVSIPY
jgi:sensor histidine kinase regulating citrate/malate metabolism